jgi:hypothetical protein
MNLDLGKFNVHYTLSTQIIKFKETPETYLVGLMEALSASHSLLLSHKPEEGSTCMD